MPNILALSKRYRLAMNIDLQRETDLCVKCGLCLPYCPTYRKTSNENESPRGRIALIQGWASGKLAASSKLQAHIDRCLLCRTCERVCPAEVPYGRLVDRFRDEIRPHRSFRVKTALMKWLVSKKSVAERLPRAVQWYRRSGLQSFLRRTRLHRLGHWHATDQLLQFADKQDSVIREFYPTVGASKGTVGLFKGCLGELLDRETVEAALHCLTASGFDVWVPSSQNCCGAMHRHDGDSETASTMAENNVRAFAGRELLAVISIASGCGSQLLEYPQKQLADRVVDVSSFLLENAGDLGTSLKPVSETVCLHTPCSLRNVMKQELGTLRLLQKIPDIRLVEMAGDLSCCGSAGAYMLEYPAMAEALADDMLASLSQSGAGILVTSNIGCAVHFRAVAGLRNLPIEILHPVTLLKRQWRSI